MTKLGICIHLKLIRTYLVKTYTKEEREERFYVRPSDEEHAVIVHELQSALRFMMGFSNVYF